MRKEKEIKDKIIELKEKAFDILNRNYAKALPSRTSLKSINLIVDSLEYALGNRKELKVLLEYKRDIEKDGRTNVEK